MRSYPHIVKGIDPVADAFTGTVTTDVVSMRDHALALFIVGKGVGTTGTSTITILACDDFTPSTTSAIPFYYQAVTSGDTHGAHTYCAATGFTTTVGSSQRYLIYVPEGHLAASGYGNVQLSALEVADNPVLGFVDILLLEPHYDKPIGRTEIA